MLGRYPGPELPRRIMPNVLGVRTLEVRNPMPFLVLVKANDAPKHYVGPGFDPGPGRISM